MIPTLLALETSGSKCSVALWHDGECFSDSRVAERKHGQILLPMIQLVMSEAGVQFNDLEVLAFSRGPGSFTGVRMATSVVQSMSYALDIPVVGVSSLAVLAQTASGHCSKSRIGVAVDARMEQVYWGVYVMGDSGVVCSVEADKVCMPKALTTEPGDLIHCYGVGDGWNVYQDVLMKAFEPQGVEVDVVPEATALADLALVAYRAGDVLTPQDVLPVYLNSPV